MVSLPFVAGHGMTATMFPLAVVALLDHPDNWPCSVSTRRCGPTPWKNRCGI